MSSAAGARLQRSRGGSPRFYDATGVETELDLANAGLYRPVRPILDRLDALPAVQGTGAVSGARHRGPLLLGRDLAAPYGRIQERPGANVGLGEEREPV